jgi:hypothetical protein
MIVIAVEIEKKYISKDIGSIFIRVLLNVFELNSSFFPITSFCSINLAAITAGISNNAYRP